MVDARPRGNFGAHMSIAGGHDRAIRAADALGMTAAAVFTKSNSQWRAAELTDAHIGAFKAAMAQSGVGDAVGHNSYLINLASPDDALWRSRSPR